MRLFIYLSEIIKRQVVDIHNKEVGRVVDFSMLLDEKVFPRADYVLIEKGFFRPRFALVPVTHVQKMGKRFKLNVALDTITFQKNFTHDGLFVCRDVLDQQVVDINHQKVVRVNDAHLLRVDNQIYLAHVEVGLRGLFRRLDWEPFIDGLVKLFRPRSAYLVNEELLSWKHTQILTIGRSKNVLKSDVARKKLARIPTAQLADIMEDLDIFEKLTVFQMFNVDLQRDLFTDLAPAEKLEIIDRLDDKEAAQLLSHIPADEATDVLMNLSKSTSSRIMRHMHTKTSRKLRKLLGFAKDSAGGLMTTEYLCLPPTAKVSDAWSMIKNHVNDAVNIYHIYIIDDDNRLLGSTSMRRFVDRDPDSLLMDTCYPNRIFVRTDDEVEEVSILLEKYKFSAIPVLGEDDTMQGVITSDDVMEELISLIWTKYKDQI